jgi:hypothetical protein
MRLTAPPPPPPLPMAALFACVCRGPSTELGLWLALGLYACAGLAALQNRKPALPITLQLEAWRTSRLRAHERYKGERERGAVAALEHRLDGTEPAKWVVAAVGRARREAFAQYEVLRGEQAAGLGRWARPPMRASPGVPATHIQAARDAWAWVLTGRPPARRDGAWSAERRSQVLQVGAPRGTSARGAAGSGN